MGHPGQRHDDWQDWKGSGHNQLLPRQCLHQLPADKEEDGPDPSVQTATEAEASSPHSQVLRQPKWKDYSPEDTGEWTVGGGEGHGAPGGDRRCRSARPPAGAGGT